jgi:FtsZ-interacting cell division protein ZipA
MSTTWIIVIVVVAVIVLALLLGWLGRSRRTGKRREEAAGLREEAQTRSRRAQQAELAAEEHAERAKREREAADEHAARAREVDPDIDDRDEEQAANRT